MPTMPQAWIVQADFGTTVALTGEKFQINHCQIYQLGVMAMLFLLITQEISSTVDNILALVAVIIWEVLQ